MVPAPGCGQGNECMGRLFIVILGVVAVVLVAGMIVLGAFPPGPRTEQVQRVLPNDRFQPR